MKFFDLFKGKKEEASPAQEDYQNALSLYHESKFQEALGALSWGFRKDVNYQPLYQLSVDSLNGLGAKAEADLFDVAQQDFYNFDAFNHLGQHFYELDQYDLAIPFLEKAVEIAPNRNEVGHDLAIVLARTFQIQKAIDALEKYNVKADFWDYWFWLKLKIMVGEVKEVEEGIKHLFGVIAGQDNEVDVEFPRQKVEELNEMFLRFKVIDNPRNHIQEWHFIQYGCAILDFFDDSENFVAGGRYVALWGSNQSILEIILKLKYLLSQTNVVIEHVKYLQDRSSQIIGSAIGKIMDLPSASYIPNEQNNKCLIIAANSLSFGAHEELSTIKNNQITFALNHSWLENAAFSPDIIGVMSQSYYFPWDGGGIKFNQENGTSETTEIDNRKPEIIANLIVEEVAENSSFDSLTFYFKNKDYLKGIGHKVNSKRFNFMIESPIPGARFG